MHERVKGQAIYIYIYFQEVSWRRTGLSMNPVSLRPSSPYRTLSFVRMVGLYALEEVCGSMNVYP